ncbi:MAG TPA: ABC transporter ATP-binding protein [Thermomicrobiales bacterium]|nr:ABC transporter ATP-binding protein [Thermomicrobiales bacterium]
MASGDRPLLALRNLTIGYQTQGGTVSAVEDVSLEIPAGRSVGIVGESGSGKSTVAAGILRLLPTNARVSGEVDFAGTNLLTVSEGELNRRWRWRQLSTVAQRSMSALSPVHRIGDQLNDVLHQHEPRLGRAGREARIADLLRATHLPERVLRAYPFELSGGMMQRTMIALGLLCQPPFLILDESTTALDVITQGQILREVSRLREQFDLTLMVISHDVGVINATADAVAVLYAGQLMEVAPRERFFSAPSHPYSQALVASVPRVRGQSGRLRGIPGSLPDLRHPPTGCRFAPRCLHAQRQCDDGAPPMVQLAPGHTVRCVLYQDQPEVTTA